MLSASFSAIGRNHSGLIPIRAYFGKVVPELKGDGQNSPSAIRARRPAWSIERSIWMSCKDARAEGCGEAAVGYGRAMTERCRYGCT